jgi:hypothetical protein
VRQIDIKAFHNAVDKKIVYTGDRGGRACDACSAPCPDGQGCFRLKLLACMPASGFSSRSVWTPPL